MVGGWRRQGEKVLDHLSLFWPEKYGRSEVDRGAPSGDKLIFGKCVRFVPMPLLNRICLKLCFTTISTAFWQHILCCKKRKNVQCVGGGGGMKEEEQERSFYAGGCKRGPNSDTFSSYGTFILSNLTI